MMYADCYCECTENFENNEQTYTFTGPCIITRKNYSVTVKARDLYKYRQGALIQEAFPYLSPEDREFLISGYSPEGWNKIMKGIEE